MQCDASRSAEQYCWIYRRALKMKYYPEDRKSTAERSMGNGPANKDGTDF